MTARGILPRLCSANTTATNVNIFIMNIIFPSLANQLHVAVTNPIHGPFRDSIVIIIIKSDKLLDGWGNYSVQMNMIYMQMLCVILALHEI
jgi:hypothetical protein